MLSTAVAAWRNLIKRLSADWLILAAATVTILAAMILLAAGPIYANAVTQSALGRTLSAATLADSTIVIEVRSPPTELEAVDRIATEAIAEALSGVETAVHRLIDAETLELPSQNREDTVDLAQIRVMESVAGHSDLVAGKWPDPSESPVETAVSSATADRLDLEIGDILEMTDRRDRDRRIEVEVVGMYQPHVMDRFWHDEELALDGVTGSGEFRTFGPFLVDETSFAAVTNRAVAKWRVDPDFETLDVGEAPRIRAEAVNLAATLNNALAEASYTQGRVSEFTVDTGLHQLLVSANRSLTVTRSTVVALLVQLAILAGYALALTAGLLAETRSTETGLLRARGASPGQVVAVAGFEGALLTIPAALVAPWLAARTLEALAAYGPLARVDLVVNPSVTTESRLIVFFAAAAAVVALVWPAWRSARSLSGSPGRRSRQRARSGAQRAGVDIALVALAVLAFWQLQSLGPQVTSTIQGRFGVDPVLIAAPTLGLLAGSVLALRIVPLVARLAERVAAAGRSSVSALSAWQVARRPLRYARSALLLIMAVAIGFFAASYSSTWLDSQRDQADFGVGADLRVQPNRRTGDSITDLHLVSAHESIPGVADSMPVTRLRATLPGSRTSGELLLLDSAAAADVVVLREGLDDGFSGLMTSLQDGRPDLGGIVVPGEPQRLGVIVEAVEEEREDADGHILEPVFSAEARLVLQDAHGLLHRVDLGPVEVNQGLQNVETSLVTRMPDGSTLTPTYPINIVALELTSRLSSYLNRSVTFDVVAFMSEEPSGGWQSLEVDFGPDLWAGTTTALGTVIIQPGVTVSPDQPDDTLRLQIETGEGHGVAEFSIAGPWPSPPTYPVVATGSWLEETGLRVGDEVRLDSLSTGRSHARISGVIDAFPTTGSTDAKVILVDLPTFQTLGYNPGRPIIETGEHWLSTTGDTSPVAGSLLGQPVDAQDLTSRVDRFLTLSTDPVALGTIGALSIGFIAAAVFAAVGFAVSATVSARERITEFALLRALGLSPRQLGIWMTLEQGTLVVSSLLLGTLVGWLLTATILPLVALTQDGTRPIPDVAIVYPWNAVFLLEAGLVAVLTVIVIVMTILLRRLGLGSLLRLGEQ